MYFSMPALPEGDDENPPKPKVPNRPRQQLAAVSGYHSESDIETVTFKRTRKREEPLFSEPEADSPSRKTRRTCRKAVASSSQQGTSQGKKLTRKQSRRKKHERKEDQEEVTETDETEQMASSDSGCQQGGSPQHSEHDNTSAPKSLKASFDFFVEE